MNASALPAPSRAEVEAQLLDLVAGRRTRDEVTSWAMQWVFARDARVDDPAVWAALNNLQGADAPSTDRPYLYGEVDFQAWLDEVRGG